jgi:hypothetical protein
MVRSKVVFVGKPGQLYLRSREPWSEEEDEWIRHPPDWLLWPEGRQHAGQVNWRSMSIRLERSISQIKRRRRFLTYSQE